MNYILEREKNNGTIEWWNGLEWSQVQDNAEPFSSNSDAEDYIDSHFDNDAVYAYVQPMEEQ